MRKRKKEENNGTRLGKEKGMKVRWIKEIDEGRNEKGVKIRGKGRRKSRVSTKGERWKDGRKEKGRLKEKMTKEEKNEGKNVKEERKKRSKRKYI